MPAGILDLLRQAKAREGLTDDEVGARAQLTAKNRAQAVQDVLRRQRVIHVTLADWALRHTVYAGDAVTQALALLRGKGLTPEQEAGLLAVLKTYGLEPAQTSAPSEKLPAGTVIGKPTELPEVKLTVKPYNAPKPDETDSEEPVASKAQEDKPAYSDQDAAAWVRGLAVKKGARSNVDLGQAVPHVPIELPYFDERAAADGLHGSTAAPGPLAGVPLVHETEPSDVRFARRDHFQLRVTGNSMDPEIREGDTIVVKRMDLYMPAYDSERPSADPKAWRALDGRIVVAILDDGLDAVVKRISVIKRRDTGFKVLLLSDNRKVKPIEVDKTNSIRVIGQVVQVMHTPSIG